MGSPVRAAEIRPPTGKRVVQFRAFNAAEETKAFLGRGTARVISEADPTVLPLQVLVAYPVDEEGEGPVQTVRLRLDASRTESSGREFTSSELFRQVVAVEDEVTSVGDFEVLNAYRLTDAERGRVSVRNRVVKYLVPGDELYGEAAGGAVSLLDFNWDMRRVETCVATPYGKRCLEEPAG